MAAQCARIGNRDMSLAFGVVEARKANYFDKLSAADQLHNSSDFEEQLFRSRIPKLKKKNLTLCRVVWKPCIHFNLHMAKNNCRERFYVICGQFMLLEVSYVFRFITRAIKVAASPALLGGVTSRVRQHFVSCPGIPELQQALCEFHTRYDRLEGLGADQFIVGPGSKELIFLLMTVFNGGRQLSG